MKLNQLLVSAPAGVSVAPGTSTSITATVTEAVNNNGVDHYLLQIKTDLTKPCQARPGHLSCSINGLSPASQYTVQAKSCLSQASGLNPCNPNVVEGQGWTTPSSNNLINIKMISYHVF